MGQRRQTENTRTHRDRYTRNNIKCLPEKRREISQADKFPVPGYDPLYVSKVEETSVNISRDNAKIRANANFV